MYGTQYTRPRGPVKNETPGVYIVYKRDHGGKQTTSFLVPLDDLALLLSMYALRC